MSFLSKIIPASLKSRFSKILQATIVEPTLKFRFGGLYENQTSIIKYIPFKRDEDYIIHMANTTGKKREMPWDYFAEYGNNQEEYYASGNKDVQTMNDALIFNGYTNRRNQRVLDLGCGSGRMTSNLNKYFDESELWGVDINSGIIYWCKEALGKSANYATNTLIPHLPFESNYFDLIYCGSVFTHIDDLAESWLLEVRRILKKDGIFYVTIHDENSIKMLDNEYKEHAFAKYLDQNKTYVANKHSFGMMVIDRDNFSQIFFSKMYFKNFVEPFFEILQIIEGAYGYQSVAVLRKK